MITPTQVQFVRDDRCTQPELLVVTVPRGTSQPEAVELRDALSKLWPVRDVRVFEAPNLQQMRLA